MPRLETQPDPDNRRTFQAYSGMGLLGMLAQKLMFHYGTGANGKSTFLEALKLIFGDYQIHANYETFTNVASMKATYQSTASLTGDPSTYDPSYGVDGQVREGSHLHLLSVPIQITLHATATAGLSSIALPPRSIPHRSTMTTPMATW